jgi:hypothetical protein
VTGLDCPCGEVHELSAAIRAAYANVTAGLPVTVRVRIGDGRCWRVPRIYIAAHGLKAGDLPALAARYGFERVP